jgi:hypothetical protein
MATANHWVQPTNKIVLDSKNLHTQTMKIETVDYCYPGRWVQVGTNDDDAICGAAANDDVIGWIGYDQTSKTYRPATIATIQVVNDQVTVCNGPGVVFLGALLNGCTVVKGGLLAAAAQGTMSPATAGTHDVIAIAEESISTSDSAGACSDIIVRSLK